MFFSIDSATQQLQVEILNTTYIQSVEDVYRSSLALNPVAILSVPCHPIKLATLAQPGDTRGE
jgi:hypothetical protein